MFNQIGNAQTAGMQEAIGANGHQWAQVVSLFYLGYVLSQFASSVQLRQIGPQLTIGGGVVFWGVMTMLLSVVKSWSGGVAVRVFIGFGEGYVHAASLYLTMWYGPEELATRAAIYFSTSTLAGAFNGLIAYGIIQGIGNTPPYQAWQWIVLIEGTITIAAGLMVGFLLPNVPERVRWGFSSEEKRLLIIRTWRANNTPGAKFNWNQIGITFKDPGLYAYVLMFMACQIGVACLASFLPAVVHDLGYSSVRAQLMTVPIYACGFVGTILLGYLSDKFNRRGICVLSATIVSLIGYGLLAGYREQVAPRYAALCLIATAQYANTNLILSWVAFNTRQWTHRATAGACVTMFGQAAALGGLQGFDTEPPYFKGNIIVMICVVTIIPACSFNMWYYTRQNKRKDAVTNHPETEIQRQSTFEEIGNAHPDFRYTI